MGQSDENEKGELAKKGIRFSFMNDLLKNDQIGLLFDNIFCKIGCESNDTTR